MEEKRYKLSFHQREFVNVTILKIFSPATFLVKEAPSVRGSEEAKSFTNLEKTMDMYYKTYQVETNELPCSGSVVAVCPDRNNWYRAMVESILETTKGPRVSAYLLDYGKTVKVEKFYVRKPFPRFYEVPFQALEFHLHDIVPCSLTMQPDCLMAYGQAEEWDIAAEEFVKRIVHSECCVQMNVVHVDSDGILYGDLLVSVDAEIVSLSKELTDYHFALSITKTKMADHVYKTEEKMHYSDPNITMEHCTAKKLERAKQNNVLEVGETQINEKSKDHMITNFKCDSQEKGVSSTHASLLTKLQCHQNRMQHLEHDVLYESKFYKPVTKLNENEELCSKKKQVNFTDGKKSVFSDIDWDSSVGLTKNISQLSKKRDSKTEDAIDLSNNKQSFLHASSFKSSSCNLASVKLLERLQAKLHYLKSDNSTNKSHGKLIPGTNFVQSERNKEAVHTNNSTIKLNCNEHKEQNLEDICALQMNDSLNTSKVSQCLVDQTAGNSNVYETNSGKLHYLQVILQKIERKQEFQHINCEIEKSDEIRPDHYDTAIHQDENKEAHKPSRIMLDLSDKAICPKSENSLSMSSCENNEIEIKTHHSNEHLLKSSGKNHIFNKYLSTLNDLPKQEIEKNVLMKKDICQTTFENMSPSSCNVNTQIIKRNISSNSIILQEFENHSLSPSKTDPFLVNNTFTMNKVKLKQNESSKQAIRTDSLIIPHKNINAHFKTTMDKWEGTLWDDNKMMQTLCFGKGKPRPIKTIASVGFNSFIVQSLKEMHFPGPLPLQTIMWPSILRGRNVVCISPSCSGKTFGYLLPLLSHISEPSFYEGLPATGGPLALILCSSWKKAQNLHDHCRILLDRYNQVKVLVTYGGGCEKLQMMSLVNGCDVLIATPSSLLRLLQSDDYKIVDLKRCCHIIIDDGDCILEVFKEEIVNILKEYGTCLQNHKHLTVPNQIIVCCEHWKNSISSFQQHCMLDPLTLIASPFEAAIYAHVSTYCHFISKLEIYSILSSILDGSNGKRVVICTSDDVNAKYLYQLLQNMSIFSILILSSALHYEVNSLINEWNSMLSPNTVHVLVVTDGILLDTGISNANCLIQCNLESTSRTYFEWRYSCLMDNYCSTKEIPKKALNCTCHLLLTEDCVNIAPALVNLLQPLPLKIPQKLHLMAKERKKQLETNKSDLCYYLKAYGHCPNENSCKKCHTVSKDPNKVIELPKHGQVKVLVCYVIDAVHYYARIIEYSDLSCNCTLSPSSYLDINLKLVEYYSIKDNCKIEDRIEVGKICVIERPGSTYHRVQIKEIVHYNSLGLPRRVKIHYLDEGWQEVDDAEKLLKISSELAAYPIQIVEVYICRVQPIDKCYEWTPQASTYVHNMIGEKEMTGKIMLTLGCTMWLDPFVHYAHIDKSNIVIKELNVRIALIKEGFAMTNCNHIENLYALCDGIVSLPSKSPEVKMPINTNIQHAFLELNKEHCVYVYAIQSPDVFFIQRYDRVDLIDSLQKELQELHKKHKLKKIENIQKGLICLAPFNEDSNYYRARIEEVQNSKSDEVYLFFVDFGDRDFASIKDLYCIPQEYLLLPFQAIECSLGGISAPNGGWNGDVNDVFDSLIITADEVRKPLFLKVLKKKPSIYTGGHHYIVKLWEEGSESCNLSEALVNQGMAISVDLPAECETIDTSTLDENLTDEESEMAVAFFGSIGLKNSLTTTSKNVLKASLNKVKNDNHKSNSTQKQVLLSDYNSIPLDKYSTGYTVPQVLWWQKKDVVRISIQLIGVKKFDADFKEKHISFATRINGKLYRFEEDLYDFIDLDKSKKSIKGQYVELILMKLKRGITWPRLTASSRKKPYIRTNFDHLDDSSSDEQSFKVIKTDPKDIIHFEPSDVECSDDDEQWTDLHYNDNFYQI